MTKSPWKNVPDVGIRLGEACMPSEQASDRATGSSFWELPFGGENTWSEFDGNNIAYYDLLALLRCQCKTIFLTLKPPIYDPVTGLNKHLSIGPVPVNFVQDQLILFDFVYSWSSKPTIPLLFFCIKLLKKTH